MPNQHKLYLNYLCGIIPAFILIIPASAEIAFAILFIWSLIYCYQYKLTPFSYNSSKIILAICGSYFIIALLSILLSDISLYAFKRLGTNIHFLAAPWISVLFVKNINLKTLNYSIKIGAILAGGIALIQFFHINIRAHGVVNAIFFGNIALLFSFFSLINIHEETRKHQFFSVLSFVLGFTAVILSLSRGAWISIPFLSILLLFIWRKKSAISFKLFWGLIFISMLTITGASLSPQINSRFSSIQKEINNFEKNNLTSTGRRIILWETAIKAISEQPIKGFGLHNSKKVMSEFIGDPDLKKEILIHPHFHNQYLIELVGKGIPGLISFLLLLLLPLILSYKLLATPNILFPSSIILMLCTSNILWGLTDASLGHGITNTFFIFMLSASSISFNLLQNSEISE